MKYWPAWGKRIEKKATWTPGLAGNAAQRHFHATPCQQEPLVAVSRPLAHFPAKPHIVSGKVMIRYSGIRQHIAAIIDDMMTWTPHFTLMRVYDDDCHIMLPTCANAR